ncbi:recombinase family protein [Kitasatospora paranensis]|uniref:recombinase family protein n=1 Tax=Kitasatospora paranensis TaxID=258053 RepID=UPI0031E5A8A2
MSPASTRPAARWRSRLQEGTTSTSRGRPVVGHTVRDTGGQVPKPIRAALYLRLSRDAEDSTSIASQEQDCRDFCRLRGWEVVQVVSDVDVSGAIRPEDRSGFREILDNLSEVDVVVARSVDRFSRVTAHFAALVEMLTGRGATLADVQGQVDLTSPYGKFVTTIMVAFAEMERETIKARILRSRGELRRQGRWLGGAAPYGFRLVEKDGGKALDLDGYAQGVLTRVVRRVVEGVTLSQEVDRLNSSGERSPGTYRKLARGEWHPPMVWEEWTYSALYQLLRSEVLRGYRVVGKRSDRRAVRDEFGAPVRVGPALLDDETWYELQDALDRAGQTNRRPRRKATLLLHVAWCPNCDETLYYNSREYRGKRLDLYTCEAARYKRVRDKGLCPGISVNAARLEEQVEDWLLTRFGPIEFQVQRRVGGEATAESSWTDSRLTLMPWLPTWRCSGAPLGMLSSGNLRPARRPLKRLRLSRTPQSVGSGSLPAVPLPTSGRRAIRRNGASCCWTSTSGRR